MSTANAPRIGLMSAAPAVPWAQNPAARIIGRPTENCGTSPPGCWEKPAAAKVSPGWGPPNAASDCGMGSNPCSAIQ